MKAESVRVLVTVKGKASKLRADQSDDDFVGSLWYSIYESLRDKLDDLDVDDVDVAVLRTTPRHLRARSVRPLGKEQKEVLRCLREHRGHYWHEYCGWVWDSNSRTKRICESLKRRGLVRETRHDSAMGKVRAYELVDDGESKGS